MLALKDRRLFLSHAWSYDSHYNQLVKWFDDEPNFDWANYSVPSHDACSETTNKGLKECLTRQMRPTNGIIIMAGMYAAHSDWIDYEIDEAVRMGKTIIGIKSWGQERIPQKIQDAASTMVSWQSASIISAVRVWI